MAEKKTAAKKAAKPKAVFAQVDVSFGWAGGVVRLTKDEPWSSDDPVVKEHPEYFGDQPVSVRSTVHPRHGRVERAIANPGYRRG